MKSNLKVQKQENTREEVKQLEIDHVFCEVLLFCKDTNMFGPGLLRHVKRGPSRDRGEGGGVTSNFEPQEFSTFCNPEVLLNKEMLSFYSTGKCRLERYFNEFLKEGTLDDPSRTENAVSLTLINPLMSEKDKISNQNLTRSTILNVFKINEYYTVDELQEEIIILNSSLPDDQKEPARGNKHALCQIVLSLREKHLAIDSQWDDKCFKRIQEELSSRCGKKLVKWVLKLEKSSRIISLLLQSPAKESARLQEHTFTDDNNTTKDVDDDDDDGSGAVIDTLRMSMGLSKHLTHMSFLPKLDLEMARPLTSLF